MFFSYSRDIFDQQSVLYFFSPSHRPNTKVNDTHRHVVPRDGAMLADLVTRSHHRCFRRTVPAALAVPETVLGSRKGPWQVRPRQRRRPVLFQVAVGRTERVDRPRKRRTVQRGLLETHDR